MVRLLQNCVLCFSVFVLLLLLLRRNLAMKEAKKRKIEDNARSGKAVEITTKKKQQVKAEAEADDDDTNEIAAVDEDRDYKSRHCPYLDTINRSVLDFDFEKLCSVSLTHLNVYACLVCGKYFQGRGPKSYAYIHSVEEDHHVFLNLETHRFYCLPDNYEIIDSSLADIVFLLNPTFTPEEVSRLDVETAMSRAHDSTLYLPGVVGLNNIKANDYCNVILQALSHVSPLRNYFLCESNYRAILAARPPGDQLYLVVQRFGELLRKLWNPRNFRAHVSPHEMLQAIVLCSKKRFQITEQADSVELLSWFLNAMHTGLGGDKGRLPVAKGKKFQTIIASTFRGQMRVWSRKIPPEGNTEEERKKMAEQDAEYAETVQDTPFFFLTCELPAPPLYPDAMKESIIPQVPLATLMAKFGGMVEREYKTHKENFIKRYQLRKLPQYLIVCYKRFTKGYFVHEKNNTIVNFPIRDVDFTDLLAPECRNSDGECIYDLAANIIHDGYPGPGKGTYRLFVLHRGSGKWFEMQDLHVREILPQTIPLSESYIQIWARRSATNAKQEQSGVEDSSAAKMELSA